MYTVSFTTGDGQVVTRKRQDRHDSVRVTQWVYDPQRPETGWQAHNLGSRAFSFLIWATFGFGVVLSLLALIAIADA